jgi:carboxymethylenebutenolidase
MTQLGKFEKYLIEEFFDDYRAGAMSQHTFTRRVAFITGSMAAASAAMLLVGCTPQEVPRSTDPMPTPTPTSGSTTGTPPPPAPPFRGRRARCPFPRVPPELRRRQ